MAESMQSEERHPLLFLFLDDANKNSRKNRNVFFERSRSQGIMSGASTVLTQWPGHLSSCGLAMVVMVITAMFFFLMILASTVKPPANSLHPRCFRRSYDDLETNLFLVHDDGVWQQGELDILESIVMKYRQCDVELLILRKENSTYHKARIANKPRQRFLRPKRQIRATRLVHPRNRSDEKVDLNINIGATNLLKAFLERRRHLNMTSPNIITSTATIPHLPSVNDILTKFPAIIVKNMTENEFFSASPLYNSWRNLNQDALNFAARILKLWENGGITFEIPRTEYNDNTTTDDYQHVTSLENSTKFSTSTVGTTKVIHMNISPKEPSKILKDMIDIGYASFRTLPEGLVTVDEEGLHMETKTTCHAFFGEALVQLKHANNLTTVPELIKNTLKTFCVRGAVDFEYCNSINSK